MTIQTQSSDIELPTRKVIVNLDRRYPQSIPSLDQVTYIVAPVKDEEVEKKEYFCEGHDFVLEHTKNIVLPGLFECPTCTRIACDIPPNITTEDFESLSNKPRKKFL